MMIWACVKNLPKLAQKISQKLLDPTSKYPNFIQDTDTKGKTCMDYLFDATYETIIVVFLDTKRYV